MGFDTTGRAIEANTCLTISVATLSVAVFVFALDLGPGERSDTAAQDQLTKEERQAIPDAWATYSMDEQRTRALPNHWTQDITGPERVASEMLPQSDRAEGIYSVWTHRFFHAFAALFGVGAGVMLVGFFTAFPLLTALGPLVLGTAFVCLGYCMHRASREHAI